MSLDGVVNIFLSHFFHSNPRSKQAAADDKSESFRLSIECNHLKVLFHNFNLRLAFY